MIYYIPLFQRLTINLNQKIQTSSDTSFGRPTDIVFDTLQAGVDTGIQLGEFNFCFPFPIVPCPFHFKWIDALC